MQGRSSLKLLPFVSMATETKGFHVNIYCDGEEASKGLE